MVSRQFFLYILLLFCSCRSGRPKGEPEIQAFDRIRLDSGWQLNYNLAWGYTDASIERYQFIIDIRQLGPDRKFDFRMTNSNETKGSVTILESGLQSANRYNNGFRGNMVLDSNLSTVWMARNTFDSLLFGDTVSFDPEYRIFGSEFQQFTRRGMGEFLFELNGVPQRIEIMKVIPLNPNVTAEFWILNDPDNPLIIMMDLGWRIELKEINHN